MKIHSLTLWLIVDSVMLDQELISLMMKNVQNVVLKTLLNQGLLILCLKQALGQLMMERHLHI